MAPKFAPVIAFRPVFVQPTEKLSKKDQAAWSDELTLAERGDSWNPGGRSRRPFPRAQQPLG
jgi:hypothetical protein